MKRNRLTERDLSRIVKRVVKEDRSFYTQMRQKESKPIEYLEVFDGVMNALQERGAYNESMNDDAEDLAWNIFDNMREDLDYISENYENEINDILDQHSEGYDEDEEF